MATGSPANPRLMKRRRPCQLMEPWTVTVRTIRPGRSDGGNGFWEGTGAGLVAAGGHGVGQRLVGPLQVVARAEAVEVGLGLAQVGEVAVGEDLGGDGAVEALDLALGLGMGGRPCHGLDAEAQQPGFQRGQPALPGRAPGRAVVGQDGAGQPIAPKHRGQVGLDGVLLLVGAGGQAQREARVVVEHVRDGPGRSSRGRWPMKSICHNSFGAGARSGRSRVAAARGRAARGGAGWR